MSDGICVLCREPMGGDDSASTIQPMHQTCTFREVVGGIGHQIAHEYWCKQRHDPDAGLTYRQSARLVWAMADVLGGEEVARRASDV